MCNKKIKIMNGDVLKSFECIQDRKIMNGDVFEKFSMKTLEIQFKCPEGKVKIEMHKHDGSSVLHSI